MGIPKVSEQGAKCPQGARTQRQAVLQLAASWEGCSGCSLPPEKIPGAGEHWKARYPLPVPVRGWSCFPSRGTCENWALRAMRGPEAGVRGPPRGARVSPSAGKAAGFQQKSGSTGWLLVSLTLCPGPTSLCCKPSGWNSAKLNQKTCEVVKLAGVNLCTS